jgi:hypothetical protein
MSTGNKLNDNKRRQDFLLDYINTKEMKMNKDDMRDKKDFN